MIAAQHSPIAQEFAKKGTPVSYRGQIWCQVLNVHIDDVVSHYLLHSPCQLLKPKADLKDLLFLITSKERYLIAVMKPERQSCQPQICTGAWTFVKNGLPANRSPSTSTLSSDPD